MSDERSNDRDKKPPLTEKLRNVASEVAQRIQTVSRLADEKRAVRKIEREVSRNSSDSLAPTNDGPQLFDRPPSAREMEAANRRSYLGNRDPEDARIRREIAEVEVIREGLPVLGKEQWMGTSDSAKMLALQSLVNRTKDMQGRQGAYKVEVGKIETDSARDDVSRTITLNVELLERGSAKPAVQALMKELHLIMQQHAVANPKDFRELGIENIQKWADRVDGQPKLSQDDAFDYAKRVTARM